MQILSYICEGKSKKSLGTVVSFQEIKKHSTFNHTAYDLKYKNLFTAILLKKIEIWQKIGPEARKSTMTFYLYRKT